MAQSKNGPGKKGWYLIRTGNPNYCGPLQSLNPNTKHPDRKSTDNMPKRFIFTLGGVSVIQAAGYGEAEPVEHELTKGVIVHDKDTGENLTKRKPRGSGKAMDRWHGVNPVVSWILKEAEERGRPMEWSYTESEDEARAAYEQGRSVYNTLREKTGPDGAPIRLPHVEVEFAPHIPMDGSLMNPWGGPLVGPEQAAKGS